MLNVICVLKSGGDYDWDYVYKLRDSIKKFLTISHAFVCYTDMDEPKSMEEECYGQPVMTNFQEPRFFVRKLRQDHEGSWSKLEALTANGEVLYLDLDTIVLDNIDSLIKDLRKTYKEALFSDLFFMLKAFKKDEEFASGIMYWDGNYKWLFCELTYFDISKYGKWDQRYIKNKLLDKQFDIKPIENDGIVSYKHHCLDGIPYGTKIICFHGTPRPKQTSLWE